MKKILINVNSIESCIERENACLIKTKTGTLWVCELKFNNKKTFDVIRSARLNEILELPLKNKEV